MRNRPLAFTRKPPLTRINGKPRLIVRKHPSPKTRRVIPGRIHHVSTFAFVALPEVVTKDLNASERAALMEWFSKERIQVRIDHKGHHFNVTLRSTVLINRHDAQTPQAPTGQEAAGSEPRNSGQRP